MSEYEVIMNDYEYAAAKNFKQQLVHKQRQL